MKKNPVFSIACTELKMIFSTPVAWLMLIVFSAAALALGVTASVSYSAGRRAESGKGKDLGAGDGL